MTAPPGPDLPLAVELFAKLEHMSLDPPGVTRDAYGSGEERAHALIRQTGKDLGLEVNTDPAGNTFVTLPGAQALPAWIVGSHLDSVPHGGNFDGAAGVVAAMIGHRRLRQSWCCAQTADHMRGVPGRGKHLVPRILYRQPRCSRYSSPGNPCDQPV